VREEDRGTTHGGVVGTGREASTARGEAPHAAQEGAETAYGNDCRSAWTRATALRFSLQLQPSCVLSQLISTAN
jgi:hypothetical protein